MRVTQIQTVCERNGGREKDGKKVTARGCRENREQRVSVCEKSDGSCKEAKEGRETEGKRDSEGGELRRTTEGEEEEARAALRLSGSADWGQRMKRRGTWF